MLGIEGGIGSTSFKRLGRSTSNLPNVSASSHIRTRFAVSYYKRDSFHRHRYFGARLFVEEYSFLYELRTGGHGGNEYIDHNSTFLCLAPVFGLGLGGQQVLHVNFFFAGGVRLQADQVTRKNYLSGSSAPSSTQDVEQYIFRPGISFSQHMAIHNNWDIVISEGASVMIGNLTKYMGSGVHPGSVYLTAGLTRVFKRLPVPPRTERKPFKSRI
jgi:hypothetical protein